MITTASLENAKLIAAAIRDAADRALDGGNFVLYKRLRAIYEECGWEHVEWMGEFSK